MYYFLSPHLILLICCVISVEIILNFNFLSYLYFFSSLLNKVLRLFKSKNISDHWKEKVILAYSFLIFKNSFKSFLIIILIFAIFLIPSLIFKQFFTYIISIYGLIESIFLCFIYIKVRKIIFA